MDNMIQVKTFAMNSKNLMHHDRLDNSINKFLQENDQHAVIQIPLDMSVGFRQQC